MRIWIHKIDKRWWRYWKPTWLNKITYNVLKENGTLTNDIKIYRWLWFGFKIKKNY